MKPLKVRIPNCSYDLPCHKDGTSSLLIELSSLEQSELIASGLSLLLSQNSIRVNKNKYPIRARTIELSEEEANLLLHHGFNSIVRRIND